tara:strand:+ start:345 stop:572 length:228 start_codon:yes stop_codon:yes gene_type:complete
MVLDLEKEMAWVTFLDNGFEKIWHPVTDITGKHLMWSEDIMDHCRSQFNDDKNWVTFGIAPTSQMLVANSVRDNM